MDDALGVAATVRAGASAVALVEERLERIAASASLGAFWVVDGDGACAEAMAVDDAVRAGRDPGPFAGVPVGWKDCFDVAGLPTTAGSTLYGATPAMRDAAVVARTRAAGGVSVGKLAMHELAWGMMGWATGHAPLPQPARPHPHRRRVVDRLRGRRGHRPRRPGAGHGLRRLGARAGEPLRRRRREAHAGHRAARRLHPLHPQHRPRGPHRPLGARLRRGAGRARGPRDGVAARRAAGRRARRRAGGALLRGARPRRRGGLPRLAGGDGAGRRGAAARRPRLAARRRRPAAAVPRGAAAATRRRRDRRPVGLRARRGGGRHARADA